MPKQTAKRRKTHKSDLSLDQEIKLCRFVQSRTPEEIVRYISEGTWNKIKIVYQHIASCPNRSCNRTFNAYRKHKVIKTIPEMSRHLPKWQEDILFRATMHVFREQGIIND